MTTFHFFPKNSSQFTAVVSVPLQNNLVLTVERDTPLEEDGILDPNAWMVHAKGTVSMMARSFKAENETEAMQKGVEVFQDFLKEMALFFTGPVTRE